MVEGKCRQWKTNILFAYSLGKAQRVLGGLDPLIGPIHAHSAVHPFLPVYQQAGVQLPDVKITKDVEGDWSDAIIVAPPAVEDAGWTRRFGSSAGFASGWMAVRGARRRRNLDRGFVLSDHADWPGLLEVIKGTEAEQIKLTMAMAYPWRGIWANKAFRLPCWKVLTIELRNNKICWDLLSSFMTSMG